MVVVPQAMAYAAIIGINPIYGLFTAIIPAIIGAIFGSFPFLITGPTNPTALVTASVLIAFASRPDYFEYVFAIAILAGVIKIIFGLLKFGKLTKYISNSVLVGFLTAVGILIIFSQLGSLLGFKLSSAGGLPGILINLVRNVENINLNTAALGLFSISIMLSIRKVDRKLPAALITILFAILVTIATGWDAEKGVEFVNLPENMNMGFHLPKIGFRDFLSLGIPAVALALLSFMETVSIAKPMSQMTGEPLDPSREMIGQGLASLVGGFFQCIPPSGSPSRTALNVVSGARTRFAAIFSGLTALIFLAIFSGIFQYIPVAALAAVVIVSSAGLINPQLLKITWQSRLQSRAVMVISLVSALVLPLEYAVYIGILSTILIFLGESSHMNLSYLIEDESGQFIELPLEGIKERQPRIAIVNIEGDLYFAAAEDLQSQITEILKTDIKVMILRFRRTHLLASTGVMALDQIIQAARKQGVRIMLAGLQEEVLEPLQAAGITGLVGDAHIFRANVQLFDSTHRALEEARKYVDATSAGEHSSEAANLEKGAL